MRLRHVAKLLRVQFDRKSVFTLGVSNMHARSKMASKIVNLEISNVTPCVNIAVDCLSTGGVIAVPTDTIYGLATNLESVQRLYQVKGRVNSKPVALCVGEIADILKYSKVHVPVSLLEDLLPGPVTLIFERSPMIPSYVNPSTTLVGFRIPNHDFLRALCKQYREPLALTSANVSNGESTLCVDEFHQIWSDIDIIFDGGRLQETELSRKGSTVVDLSVENTFKIERPGSALHNTVKVLTSSKYGFTERFS